MLIEKTKSRGDEKRRVCKIIELKDGDCFDTKKAASEKENLEYFKANFSPKVPFVTEIYLCSFFQMDKKILKSGLKDKFEENELLNGREFCELLSLDYDEIVELRKRDTKQNLRYFLKELLKIKELRELIKENL